MQLNPAGGVGTKLILGELESERLGESEGLKLGTRDGREE